METTILSQQETALRAQPTCPVCGGPLISLRGFYRCVLCCFTICESCEGDVDDEDR